MPPIGIVPVHCCLFCCTAFIGFDRERRCIFHRVGGVKNVRIFEDYDRLAGRQDGPVQFSQKRGPSFTPLPTRQVPFVFISICVGRVS